MDAGIQEPVKEVAALAPAQEKGISAEVLHWVVGAISMLMMLALFTLAVVNTPSSVRANNAHCLRQIANEEHVALEAFFQNPTQQNAFALASEVCAR
ncbi:MAG: hypothetical protein WCA85_32855 [Paraburkholderia sp.]|uniref:hypothetical protein n=1 Tax=Paraburkholderia sp. TaxID=1926495 RepID=UPI003C3B0B0E